MRVWVSDVRWRHALLGRLVQVEGNGEKNVGHHQGEKATLAIDAQVPIALRIENASVGHVHRPPPMPRSVIALCRRAPHLQAELFFLFLSRRTTEHRGERE